MSRPPLSQNEQRAILELRARGLGSKRIAKERGLSLNTVKGFLRRVRRGPNPPKRTTKRSLGTAPPPHPLTPSNEESYSTRTDMMEIARAAAYFTKKKLKAILKTDGDLDDETRKDIDTFRRCYEAEMGWIRINNIDNRQQTVNVIQIQTAFADKVIDVLYSVLPKETADAVVAALDKTVKLEG